ncbi:uridine kinase [Paenibacillus castaneae]|nr:uridine kinase [Paenibacillus castaneae]
MEHNVMVLLKSIPTIEKGNRLIIGIDGLSRSGKTTFTNKLSHLFHKENSNVCVLHMDDYIVERNKRYNTGHEAWYEYYTLQWDVGWLKENLFEKLKEASMLVLPCYDNESDSHSMQNIKMADSCVLLIEGVFLQRKEWRNFYDYVVYLDCPREERFARESVSAQDEIKKFMNRYWKAEDYYLATEAPAKQANIVLKN